MLLDLLFPKYCINCKKIGELICSNCFALLSFSLVKKKGEGGIDGFFIALDSNYLSRKILKNFKEKHLTSLGKLIGELMFESLIQNEDFMKELKGGVLIPMPIGKMSYRKRGFNESFLIAKELSSRLGLGLADVLFYKKGKIQFRRDQLRGKEAFLVEDIPNRVRLEEAAKLLKEEGLERVFSISFINTKKPHF